MFLKGMAESSLPSEDERVTPNIDEVMSVNVFGKRSPILHEFSKT